MVTETGQSGSYVFLSYASADRARALHVADLLEAQGISVWIDRKSIAGGTSWSAEIVRGIEGCAVLVVLSSAGSMGSPNVQQEIQLAWESRRPILPLLLENVRPPESIRYALAGRQWVEVLDRSDDDWLPQALRALGGQGIPLPGRPAPGARSVQAVPAVVGLAPTLVSRNNLPAPLNSFVGREPELAGVNQLLRENRLVTLTGAGGCGKTRLAVEVARGIVDEFPDGVWLVELAPLMDPTIVPQTIASSLGMREAPGRPIVEALTEYLRHRRVLLVLDNCEHLVDACARVVDVLLRSCALVRILATSRELLGVAGEAMLRVPSMSVVDPEAMGTTNPDVVVAVLATESAQLFVDRARLVAPSFAVTGANALVLAQVCQRLDGIPLAIELAAARIAVLSIEQIASRLDQRFRLLTGGNRTALRRQQTLRATIDWSYQLLAEDERRLLRRLAVFAGGWSLEAAEAVCAGAGTSAEDMAIDDVVDVLSRLVPKSMVLVDEQAGAGSERRYSFSETIRQYAEEKLLDAGEAIVMRARHRDYVLAFAERAEPELLGRKQLEWLRRLEVEHDNLRAVLARTLGGNDPVHGLQLAARLTMFWRNRGWLSEGQRWLNLALERTGPETSDQWARGLALLGAGDLATYLADWREAEERLGSSLAILRATDDQRNIARALSLLGWVYAMGPGGHQRALTTWEEGLVVARAAGDRRGIGIALGCLGNLAFRQDDVEKARTFYDESLRMLTEVGDLFMLNGFRRNRGWLAFRLGEAAQARVLLEDALAVFERLQNTVVCGYICLELAEVAWTTGDRTRARELLTRSARLIQADGGRYGYEAVAVAGVFAWRENKHARAARLHAAVVAADYRFRNDFLYLPLAEWERLPDACRTGLGDAEFERVAAEGRAMTLEQAIEYGCSEVADPGGPRSLLPPSGRRSEASR